MLQMPYYDMPVVAFVRKAPTEYVQRLRGDARANFMRILWKSDVQGRRKNPVPL
jgi:hypothetical protein